MRKSNAKPRKRVRKARKSDREPRKNLRKQRKYYVNYIKQVISRLFGTNTKTPKQQPTLYDEEWGELLTLQFILDSETIWFLP